MSCAIKMNSSILKTLNLPAVGKSSAKELDIAIQLIDQLTVPFKPKAYKDTYTEELKQIIKQKSKGRPVHPKSAEPKPTKVHRYHVSS